MQGLILCACLVLLAGARAQEAAQTHGESRTGNLYEIGSERTRVFFRWTLTQTPEGRLGSRFFTPEGQLAAEDELVLENGAFQSYSYVRPNIGEQARVERRGEQLVFTQTWRGETRRSEEEFSEEFLAGPLVVPYIQERWAALVQGQELRIRYGVPDQLRSFGFGLRMAPGHPETASGWAVVMRAESFVVRLFVDPIYFFFSPDGQIFYGMKGRTLPVAVKGDEPQAVDAELVIDQAGAD